MSYKEYEGEFEDFCGSCGDPIFSGEEYIIANPFTGIAYDEKEDYTYVEYFHPGCEPMFLVDE